MLHYSTRTPYIYWYYPANFFQCVQSEIYRTSQTTLNKFVKFNPWNSGFPLTLQTTPLKYLNCMWSRKENTKKQIENRLTTSNGIRIIFSHN